MRKVVVILVVVCVLIVGGGIVLFIADYLEHEAYMAARREARLVKERAAARAALDSDSCLIDHPTRASEKAREEEPAADSIQLSRFEVAPTWSGSLDALTSRLGGSTQEYNRKVFVPPNAGDDYMRKFLDHYNSEMSLGAVTYRRERGLPAIRVYYAILLGGNTYDLSIKQSKIAFEAELCRLYPKVRRNAVWSEGRTYTTLFMLPTVPSAGKGGVQHVGKGGVTSGPAPLVVATSRSGVVSDKSRGIYDLRRVSDRRDLINRYNDLLFELVPTTRDITSSIIDPTPRIKGPVIFQLDGRFFDISNKGERAAFVENLCRYPWARLNPSGPELLEFVGRRF